MLNVTVANIGELTVVGCEGRIVQKESAYKLREAVTSQTDARIVVLELSEVRAIGGGGLGMLVFLQTMGAGTQNPVPAVPSFPVGAEQTQTYQINRRVLHRFERRNEGSSGVCQQPICASCLGALTSILRSQQTQQQHRSLIPGTSMTPV